MAGRFAILEHPSDIGILATAESREQALEAAARGLVSILADPNQVEKTVERDLRAEGSDPLTLPILWLTEIIYLFDAEMLLFRDFVVDEWTDTQIRGRAWGERFDATRHQVRTAVKAVTYHQFHSGPTPTGWELRVFLDV